jgi:hypothetical protein
MKIKRRKPNELAKRAKRGFRGYPVATIAFYGPSDARASKVVVGIVEQEGAKPEIIETWHNDDKDVRYDDDIGHEIVGFIRTHNVLSTVAVDRIIGCPHQEGIDYPEGEAFPECPYWRGRDRWSGETIN